MMGWTRLVFVVVLCLPLSAASQKSSNVDTQQLGLPNFQVSAEDNRKVLIVPSVHFAVDAKVASLAKSIAGFPKNTRLFLEFLPGEKDEVDHPLGSARYSPDENMKRELENSLSSVFFRLAARAGSAAPSVKQLVGIHPFFLLTAVEANCAAPTELDNASPDAIIASFATQNGWGIFSLESLDEAFVSVSRLETSQWIKLIHQASDKIFGAGCQYVSKAYSIDMQMALSRGDTDFALEASRNYHRTLYHSEVLLNAFISPERNLAMVVKIESILNSLPKNSVAVVVIGAAHFAGNNGLLKILCRHGRTISANSGAKPVLPCQSPGLALEATVE